MMEGFSIGWFFVGVLFLVAGATIVVKYQWLAHNFVSGISSYDKVKLFGLVVCGLGLLFMTNLHTALLKLLISLIVPGV